MIEAFNWTRDFVSWCLKDEMFILNSSFECQSIFGIIWFNQTLT